MRPTKKTSEKVLPSVRANAAVTAKFRKQLDTLIEEMNRSVTYWIKAQYRETPPMMATDDANAANQLQKEMRKLSKQWLKRFDEAAADMAKEFSKSAQRRSDVRMKAILRKAGISVDFKMTPAQRDVVSATTHEAVSLIRSIPQKYLTSVEGAVMRSVQSGRDLGTLSKVLQKTYGITKRRAAFIAADQNNKATASLNRARQLELGIDTAVWKHSHAGRKPRPTHLKMDGKKYDIKKGIYDSAVGRFIQPGEEPNCRCTAMSVLKGFI